MKKIFVKVTFAFSLLLSWQCVSNCGDRRKGSNPSYKSTKQTTLPAPYATKSVVKECKVISWPVGKRPVAPEGFSVTLFASNIESPRWIYQTPNGDILVSCSRTDREKSPNKIILLRDQNKDGIVDQQKPLLKGLNQPLGMLLLNHWFYVANTDGIYRYRFESDQSIITSKGEKITDLPAGGYNNHWTRNLLANANGSKIYVSVGSGSNNGENGMESEIDRAAILEINPDGTGKRIFAGGIRNPVGMAWQPGTDILWTVVNERDELGDELVPDYMTTVKDGAFYGWPYAYFGQHEDPRLKGQRPDLVAKTIVPDISLGAHTASLGLTFFSQETFPSKYNTGAFVGQHGSWNRSSFAGYKVLFIPFNDGNPGEPEDFLTGFIADETKNEVYGRPVGVLVTKDGTLLVADDAGNKIWQVEPTK